MVKSAHYIDDKYHVVALKNGHKLSYYVRKRSGYQSVRDWMKRCREDFEAASSEIINDIRGIDK